MKRVCLLFIFLTLPTLVKANVIISEVMYDISGADSGREWIEVFNNSDDSIDLSTFKLFEANTNHKLNSVNGEKNILPGGYAVIVSDVEKFKIDNPIFLGIIFDSTFSLSNSGEILIIKDKNLNVVDQKSYSSMMGGAGDGKTLQFISNSWVTSEPTLGYENKFLEPIQKTETKPKEKFPETEILEISQPFSEENSIITSQTVDNSETGHANSNTYFFVFIVFLLFCACFTYLFRRNKTNFSFHEEFEILGE